MNVDPFTPQSTGTVDIAAPGTGSANVALLNKSTSFNCRIYNSDPTHPVFIEFGTTSAVQATAPAGSTPGSMPVGPNQSVIVSIQSQVPLWAAAVSAQTNAAVYFTPGIGS
jgi:hypothetical protein